MFFHEGKSNKNPIIAVKKAANRSKYKGYAICCTELKTPMPAIRNRPNLRIGKSRHTNALFIYEPAMHSEAKVD